MNTLFDFNERIKTKMLRGEVSIGVFLLSANSFIAEAMANHPIDWMLIDMEASHASKEDVLHILQAINGYEVTPVIRVAEQSKHLIESCLDFGARGVMVPKIDTAQQAAEMSDACFYPPKGNRGINCIRASGFYLNAKQYFDKANDNILSILQIESKESISNIDGIAQTENADILFIGLGDLAASYGQNGNVSGRLMDEARAKVIEACKTHNKIPGIFAHSIDVANQYAGEGFRFIAIGNDIKFLHQGLTDSLMKIKVK